jgi:PAS domain S-box-containing protein
MTSAKKRILIAEDQRLIAADLEQTLKNLGFEVAASVASGEEAVEKAIALRPDLALLDIRLQGKVDGIQAAIAIQEHVDLPVVYLTAYADEETVQRAMITGPFGYLVKPFNERELRAAIEIAIYKHETDRLLSEERARRQAAEEFKLFANSVQDYGIFLLDTAGRVVSWNAGAERIKGYGTEEILGQESSVFYVPEEVQAGRPRAELEKAKRCGRAEDEGWRVRKDGSRFWASVVITALRDEDGHLHGFGKVVRDMTARWQSELALRNSERRKAAILNAAFDSLITIDHLGNIVEFNRTAERTFGFCRDDVVGKEMASLIIPPGLRERHRRGIAHCLASGEGPVLGKRIEFPALRADGTEFLAEIAIEVIHSDEPPLFTGFVRDISEQRRQEIRREFMLEATSILASSLDREMVLATVARLAVPRIADWSAIHVVDANERLKCVAFAHVDPQKAELVQEIASRYLPDDDAAHGAQHVVCTGKSELIKDIPDALLAHFARNAEHLAALRRVGLRSYVAAPIQTTATVLGVMTLATCGPRRLDEADRAFVEQLANNTAIAMENTRLFQETRRQRRAAEEAVRARDAFLSVASHELRNPLNTLNIVMELIQKDSRRVAENAAKLRRQLQRLNQLVDKLLDVSRISADRLDLSYEEIDLAELVREVVARFEEEIRRSGSAVLVRADASIVGLWDSMRLDQIVTNLLSNALKYGAGKPVSVRVESGREAARLIVEDHGCGIGPEDQARIFERFERVSKASGQVGGLGLGLWIVRQITTSLGGSVHVDSALGKGSTFVVELPRKRPAEVVSKPEIMPGATAQARATRREAEDVLVVEDDQDALETISDLLRSHGYTVAGAGNGREALDYLSHAAPPRVILLDLMMPVMDGPEFLHEKERAPTMAPIPVVLVSGDGHLARKADELQVDDYITKPIKVDVLVRAVERHCRAAPA